MKRFFLFLIILFKITILYSQTESVIERIDTIIQVKVPILIIEKNSLLDNITDTVLSYNVHNSKRYKDHIYSIEIQKDSLDRGYIFYVGLFPEDRLGISDIIGSFKRNEILFLCTNDSLENGYIITNKYKKISYKKEVAYKHDGKRIDEPILKLYNPPTWIFIYDKRDKKLELFRTDFILPNEINERLYEEKK